MLIGSRQAYAKCRLHGKATAFDAADVNLLRKAERHEDAAEALFKIAKRVVQWCPDCRKAARRARASKNKWHKWSMRRELREKQ